MPIAPVQHAEARELLVVGRTLVYPTHGPGFVERISTRTVNGQSIRFYHIVFLDKPGVVLVPIEKAHVVGLRELVKPSEIPALLERLGVASASDGAWKDRATYHRKLLASGSVFDLADLISSLTTWSASHTLSPTERQTLDRAKSLLICEVSAVTSRTRSSTERVVEDALAALVASPRAE